jgi:hypothetical protein
MKRKIFIMIAALAILSFTSCSKSDVLDQPGIDLADDDAVSEAVFEDIFNSVDNAEAILDGYLKGDAKSMTESGTCPVVTTDRPPDAKWPKTVTIDYGTGCTGFHDNTRSGKIIIAVTAPRLIPGSVKTVTFDNYFFNGIKVEGTKTIENMGYNNNENLVFDVTLENGKLTLPDGKTIERSFVRQREWISGAETRNIWDDEFLITGTTTGVNVKGLEYTNTITTALHSKRACRFIVSGVVRIEREGMDSMELNYGEGGLHNQR